MDELYDDEPSNTPANYYKKVDLTPEPVAYNDDPFFELTQLKKKHGQTALHKHLNEKFNDNFRRTNVLKNRLKQKLEKKNILNNNKNESN